MESPITPSSLKEMGFCYELFSTNGLLHGKCSWISGSNGIEVLFDFGGASGLRGKPEILLTVCGFRCFGTLSNGPYKNSSHTFPESSEEIRQIMDCLEVKE